LNEIQNRQKSTATIENLLLLYTTFDQELYHFLESKKLKTDDSVGLFLLKKSSCRSFCSFLAHAGIYIYTYIYIYIYIYNSNPYHSLIWERNFYPLIHSVLASIHNASSFYTAYFVLPETLIPLDVSFWYTI